MTWQETAKRLRDQPWWPKGEDWPDGCAYFDHIDPEKEGWPKDRDPPWYEYRHPEVGHGLEIMYPNPWAFPILTDWATVGVLLGMVIELERNLPNEKMNERLRWYRSWIQNLWYGEIPGQAIAELLMELKA